jgi:hypothetical protein
VAAVALTAVVIFVVHQNNLVDSSSSATATVTKLSGESPLMAKAAAALAANRLTEPGGDNALELYLQAQSRNPADPTVRAGLAEVHERLLAKAENALLEERLDEASAAIEVARRSGVEAGRIAFLSAQLAKLRDQVKVSQAQGQALGQAQAQAAQSRARPEAKPDDEKVTALLGLAAQRADAGRLLEPADDNARSYVTAMTSWMQNARWRRACCRRRARPSIGVISSAPPPGSKAPTASRCRPISRPLKACSRSRATKSMSTPGISC